MEECASEPHLLGTTRSSHGCPMKLPRSPVSPNHPAAQELEALDASPREASRERPRAHPVREARRRCPAAVARSLSGLPRTGGLARGNRNRRRLDLLPPTASSTSPPRSGIPTTSGVHSRPPRAPPLPASLAPAMSRVSKPLRSVRIRSTALVRLLHGLGLLPSGISVAGTGNAMI